jgi:uncharacterized protein (TIGR02391 family)
MDMIDRYSQELTIVRHTADGDKRTPVRGAFTSADKVTFRLGVDVEEGDLIEQALPGGKVKTHRAARVIPRMVPARAARITVEVEPVSTKPAVAPRRVKIAGMHPAVSAAAGALFADQHYSRAVFAAFQALEHRVQQQTGITATGVDLMNRAFSPKNPVIDLARHSGRNAKDEREGFHFLMVGAIQALRNPRGHGEELPDGVEEALEYLTLASLLFRRIGAAQA